MIFSPKKFIAMLELNDSNLTQLIKTKAKVYRSFFIPRYKEGTKSVKKLDFNYTKRISDKSIQKIFNGLVELGIAKKDQLELVKACFREDNYDALLPEELL